MAITNHPSSVPWCPRPYTRNPPQRAGRYWCKIGHGAPEITMLQDPDGWDRHDNLHVLMLGMGHDAMLALPKFLELHGSSGLAIWWAPERLVPPLGWKPEAAGACDSFAYEAGLANFWRAMWVYAGWRRLYVKLDRAADAALKQPCADCNGTCGHRDATGLADSEDKPLRNCPACDGHGNQAYTTDTNLILRVARRMENALLRLHGPEVGFF